MNQSRIASALIVAAALVAVGWIGRDWSEPDPPTTRAQVCVALEEVRGALDLSSLGDQAVLPTRAAELADLLARRPEGSSQPNDLAAARRIVAVLEDEGATVADLVDAIAPVARQCGQEPLDR